MTGKAKKQKRKSTDASTSGPAPTQEPMTTSFPWPRPDNTPFLGLEAGLNHVELIPHTTMKKMQEKIKYRMYKHGDAWSHHHCTFYNGLLRVEMAPTRFICYQTLQKMGIAGDVKLMLRRMGLEQIAQQQYPLYPELVRQFLASAELTYEDGALPTASEGTLSYFSSGILYEISIRELCVLYGFDESAESCHFPSDFPQVTELWGVIGSGGYESRTAKLGRIRNPVIRVVAKIIGNTLFAKEESGSVKLDELKLLHFGLPPFFREIYNTPPPERLSTNLGVIFAENLVNKKARGLNTVHHKVERIGSLLTPIFMHHGIDLTSTPCEPAIHLLDEQYFKNSCILSKRDSSTSYMYQYQDRTGTLQQCKLPLREHTTITSRANLEFLPPPEFHHQTSTTRRYRGSSSTAPTSQTSLEDDRAPQSFPQPTQHTDEIEYALPPYTGEYDLPPLEADATDAEFRAWMVESQRKNNSMMQKIWGALARIRCPRPPACFRPTETREDHERTDDVVPPTAHVPDVAGHRTSGDDDDDNLSDQGCRLERRRRGPGQSRSISPEDH